MKPAEKGEGRETVIIASSAMEKQEGRVNAKRGGLVKQTRKSVADRTHHRTPNRKTRKLPKSTAGGRGWTQTWGLRQCPGRFIIEGPNHSGESKNINIKGEKEGRGPELGSGTGLVGR